MAVIQSIAIDKNLLSDGVSKKWHGFGLIG
jgi:hypothetical protein